MNLATFWPCLVLFGLAAGRVLGADVGTAEGQHPVKACLLVPARVFDSEDGKTREGWSVLVASNRITAAGPAAKIKAPPGALKIDLPDMTLLPGLMDLH